VPAAPRYAAPRPIDVTLSTYAQCITKQANSMVVGNSEIEDVFIYFFTVRLYANQLAVAENRTPFRIMELF